MLIQANTLAKAKKAVLNEATVENKLWRYTWLKEEVEAGRLRLGFKVPTVYCPRLDLGVPVTRKENTAPLRACTEQAVHVAKYPQFQSGANIDGSHEVWIAYIQPLKTDGTGKSNAKWASYFYIPVAKLTLPPKSTISIETGYESIMAITPPWNDRYRGKMWTKKGTKTQAYIKFLAKKEAAIDAFYAHELKYSTEIHQHNRIKSFEKRYAIGNFSRSQLLKAVFPDMRKDYI